MKKFTKLWQLMLILLLSSSVVFAQKDLKKQEKSAEQKYSTTNIMENAMMQKDQISKIKTDDLLEAGQIEEKSTEEKALWKEAYKNGGSDPSSIDIPLGSMPGQTKDPINLLCPPGSQFSQPATNFTNGVTSDVDPGYAVYQYFGGLTEDITQITFWGIQLFYDAGWQVCTTPDDPMDFNIYFYGDIAGAPDLTNLLDSYTVPLDMFLTGEWFGTWDDIKRYNYTFPTALAITDAWVMIQATTVGGCWFLWLGSDTDPGTLSYQGDGVNPPTQTTFIQHMCLGGIPPTCPAPTNMTTSNITENSATANWDDVDAIEKYDIVWGLSGFDPDTGPFTGTEYGKTFLFGPPYFHDMTGFNSSTAYEWYVRADCGTDDVSAWAGPVAFTTTCGTFGVPFVESFDVNTTPVCWLNYATTGGPWVFGQLGSAGYAAALAPDHTGNGGYYAWVDFSGTDVGVVLEAPDVDVSTLTLPWLEFYLFSHNTNSSDYNILHVEAWDGAAWASVAILQGDNGGWTEYAYDLTAFTYGANLVKIRFRAESGGGSYDYHNDLLIDDISIDEAPTCFKPTGLGVANVTDVSADLLWTSNSGLSNIEWGYQGFTLGVDPLGTPTGVTSPYPLLGLSMYTEYDFYVQDDCTGTGGGLSEWAGPYSFTTACYITCPPGSTPEGEICGDSINNGCNLVTPLFGSVSDGETICGNTWDDGSSRDTDWYELVTTDPYTRITLIAEAEIEMVFGLIEQTVPGVPGCGNITGYIDPYMVVPPCNIDTLIFELSAAGTYYIFAAQSDWVGNICPGSVYWFSVDVDVIAPPAAVIDPMSFSATLPVDGTASADLNIGNTGEITLTYDADVVYGGAGTATCYPVSASRWTGTTDGTTITDVSEVRGYDTEDGWFMFDVSAIPAGATITNIDFTGYVNATNYPYWSMTPVTSDPLTATAATLHADIVAEAISGYYLYQDEGSGYATGWKTHTLGGTANADLAAALTQGWFAMGMASRDNSTTYFINWDGWNETNVPYIEVSYSTGVGGWLTLDGGISTSGSVLTGDTDIINVGFDATGIPVGVYTADIEIETNEPTKVQYYSLPVTLTVVANGYNVSGTLTYANSTSTPMHFDEVKLMSGATEYGSAITNLAGGYNIGSLVANGSYSLITSTTKAWGGLNMLDVIHTRQFLSGTITFNTLQQNAADVTNGTGTPNMLDVIVMRQRLSGPVPPLWGAPDYVYHDVAVTVAGANVIHDYESLCSGDPNGSYTPPGPTVVLSDDFEAYTAGTQLTVQNSIDWTTWSGTPGSAEDPFVSTAQANGGVNSVNIVSGNDLVKPMPNYTSGKYRMSFWMYIPTGFDGYFNTLQEFTPTPTWGMQVYFPSGLAAYIDGDGAAAATFAYSNDIWFYNEVFVYLDLDWAEYYLDGVLIHAWKWSEGCFGGNALNQLGGNNFFGHDQETTCNYYIDDYELLSQ